MQQSIPSQTPREKEQKNVCREKNEICVGQEDGTEND